MVLIVMLLGVVLVIALAMHISTEEELDKVFVGISVCCTLSDRCVDFWVSKE